MAVAGRKPLVTPKSVPLDLLFFRRVFSSLNRLHGDARGEVPISVFQRTMVRLFRVLGMKEDGFDPEEYDKDGSCAVGWYEFVSCWRSSEVAVHLGLPERIFLAIEDPSTCFYGEVANVIVTVLIFISCVLFIIGTMPSLRNSPCETCEPLQLEIFDVVEGVCIGVFTFEYVVRFCTAPFARSELLEYEKLITIITGDQPMNIPSPLVRFLRFVIQPMNLIDVFVIAPFYVELLAGMVVSNFTVLRVLRLTRLFRLVKLGKYFEVLEIIVRVFRRSTKMFYVLGVYLILCLCFSSAAMYYVESGSWDPVVRDYVRVGHDGASEVTPFRSIPHAFWWCVVTFTTVGYGDVFPITVMGKLVASCTMIVGILVLAMPISVISMNFTEVWTDWNEEKRLDEETRQQDLMSVYEALEGMESRSHLLIELWDDRMGDEAPEFLGEVEFRNLPLDSQKPEKQECLLTLQPNTMKRATDKACGTVLTSFLWQPDSVTVSEDPGSEEPRIQGSLEVKIRRAENLMKSDWKKGGLRDVYVLVHCWPRPPDGQNPHSSDRFRTATVRGSLNPVWEEHVIFDFDWPKDWSPPPIDKERKKSRNVTRTTSMSRANMGHVTRVGNGMSLLDFGTSSNSLDVHRLGSEGSNLRDTVEEQGKEIKALASQVAEMKDVLCDIRAALLSNKAGPSPRQQPADGMKASAGLREVASGMAYVPLSVPGSVEAEFDPRPLHC